MPSNYSAGTVGKVFAGATELPAFKFTTTDKAGTQDVSNTKDGRKRIAGLNDSEGNFSLRWDASAQPTSAPPNLRAGTILVVKTYVSATSFCTASIILDEVTFSSEVEGKIDFEGKWMLESGTMTYPV